MVIKSVKKLIVFFAFLLTALSASISVAQEVTLVGEVNDNYQIYANSQLYEVANTPAGNDLVSNYISEKVEVVGTIEEVGETKIITVISFKVVPE
jgi:hypothetical protein